jgi:hypothetical protein
MQMKIDSIATLDPIAEDQTIDGFVSELERQIGTTLEGNGVPVKPRFARRFVHADALRRRFGNAKAESTNQAENKLFSQPPSRAKRLEQIDMTLPAATRLFDRVDFAGELVGYGIGIFLRFIFLSAATIVVVGLFSILVFLHGVGRGLVKKHWNLGPH